MSKKDFSVALKYVEARPRSQRRKGTEARVSGISVVGSGASATDLSLLQANLISVTNNFTALKDLFDSMFEKDSDGNIHAKLSLWSSGGITAGGVGSGGSGGGGISYNRLDSWADYSADKAGYVLSAALGKDLDNRVSALANAGYITASYLAPYALRSEIPSLDGYATQSWVGENYLSRGGGKLVYSGAQGLEAERTDGAPTHIMFLGLVNGTSRQLGGFGMNGYNDPVYVNPNGIRHKVLTAENYTDYALSKNGGTISDLIIDRNPSVIQYKKNGASVGYLGFASELKPVLYNAEGNTAYMIVHSGNYADYITNSYLKSTLGISDWALASAKPTYTASEVGALGVNDTATNANKLGGYLPTTYMRASGQYTDSLNDLTSLGIYRMSGTIKDGPTGAGGYGNLMVVRSNSWDSLSQLYFNAINNRIFVRSGTNSNFTSKDWSTLAYISDIPTDYLPLSGGTLSGSNRDLLNLDTLNTSGPRITLNENGNLIALIGCVPKQTTTDYGAYFVNVSSKFGVILGNDKKAYITLNTDTMSKDYQILHSGNYADYALSKYGGTVNGSITASSFIGNLAGNAGSATKLATPRTIWGQSFDGTQDVTGALTAPSITTNSLTIGGVTLTYDSVNEALCINGNMYALGGITAGGAGISAYTSLEARVARLEQQLNIS